METLGNPMLKSYGFGVLEPAPVTNLCTYMLYQPQLDLTSVKSVAGRIAAALSHMHERGFIHGRFKPHNSVQTGDGLWLLSDLEGATRIGEPIGEPIGGCTDPGGAADGGGGFDPDGGSKGDVICLVSQK